MKLRVRSNSVRLRLTKTEVSKLQDHGECMEAIRFPGGARLSYSLRAVECSAIQAEFERGTVNISVPQRDVVEWSRTQAVGMYATVDADGVALRVLIEKDFQCLDNTHEDQSDMFANPAAGVSC